MTPSDDPERPGEETGAWGADDLERASENVLDPWPSPQLDDPPGDPVAAGPHETDTGSTPPEHESEDESVAEPVLFSADGAAGEHEALEEDEEPAAPGEPEAASVAELEAPEETSAEHAPGELAVPPGYPVLEGEPRGARRAVGIVVSRFNGEVTGGLLEAALAELETLGVEPDSITVMPVPGAFELPLAAMALAKTRRFACIVALGCVIRGDTPHFDYVASEAASGLQLAAIETGVPVSFGVLTLDRRDQAEPRLEKGAEAVRTALEMADLFANLRAAASAR
jgi:6,7-dimethyl-8-ribityllumazine synthase